MHDSIVLSASVLVLAAGILSGCREETPTLVEPLLAKVSGPGGPQVEVPFRGSGTADVTLQEFAPGFPEQGSSFDGRCSVPSSWIIRFEGAAHITHLGKVTLRFEHCTQADLQAGIFTYTDGEFSYTAANGDALRGTYSDGTAEMVSSDLVAWQDTFVIRGGTGRFAAATGGGEDRGTTENESGYTEFLMDGVIHYDASFR